MEQSASSNGFPKSMRDIMMELSEDEISLTQKADDGSDDAVISISVYQAEIVAQWLQEAAAVFKKETQEL